MPYEQELKLRAVNMYRESGRSLRSIASEFGVAPSTLRRWVDELSYLPEPPVPSRYDAELVDVVTRLNRSEEEGVKSYAIGSKNMAISVRSANVISVLGSIVLVLSIAVAVVRLYIGLPPDVREQNPWLPAAAIAATGIASALAVSTLWDFVSRVLVPFPYAVSELHEAESGLMQLGDREIFRVSPLNLVARRKRRRITKMMSRAARRLATTHRLGHRYFSEDARDVEVAERKKVAQNLAKAEMWLHREGTDAYARVSSLLRTVIILTILKDWSLPDLNQETEVTGKYNSWPRRTGRVLRNVLGFGLGTIGVINGLLELPNAPEQLAKLGISPDYLSFLP